MWQIGLLTTLFEEKISTDLAINRIFCNIVIENSLVQSNNN